MRFKVNMTGGPHDRFTEEAARQQVGKSVPVNMPGQTESGTVVGAKLVNDGRSIELTIDVDPPSTEAAMFGSSGAGVMPVRHGLPVGGIVPMGSEWA